MSALRPSNRNQSSDCGGGEIKSNNWTFVTQISVLSHLISSQQQNVVAGNFLSLLVKDYICVCPLGPCGHNY